MDTNKKLNNDLKNTEQEEKLVSAGILRYQNQFQSLKDNGLLALSKFGKELLISLIPATSTKYDDTFKHAADGKRYVEQHLSSETAMFLALSVILNDVVTNHKLLPLANRIGNAVLDEINANQLNIPKTSSRKQVYQALRAAKPIQWSHRLISTVGLELLSSIIDGSNLLTESLLYSKGRNFKIVNFSDEYTQQFISFLRTNLGSCPASLPIEHFPIPITPDTLSGGFSFNVLANRTVIRSKDPKQIAVQHSKGNTKRVTDNLNAVQSIPYTINKKVLVVAQQLLENNPGVAGLPEKDQTLPTWVADDPKERKQYFKVRDYNLSLFGKRYAATRTIQAAENLKEAERLYFPVYTDFRGRIYYDADYLSVQSTDLGKSLLLFTAGKVIDEESQFFYYVHGANSYGLSHLSYVERNEWVEKNKSLITAVGRNPIKNLDLWKDADAPFEFLAFCDDAVKYWANPNTYESRLRCSFDASQSGLQLLSLMLRDEEGCKATNILPTPGQDGPSDLYMKTFLCLEGLLKADLSVGSGEAYEYAKYWLEFFEGRNTRKLVKTQVMTSVYNISLYGSQQYTQDWINNERPPDGSDTFSKDKYLQKRVNESVDTTIVGAKTVLSWLKDVAEVLTLNNLDFEVVLPSGFVLLNVYRKMKTILLTTKTSGSMNLPDKRYRYTNLSKPLNKIAPGKAKNSISANLVHGLDSSLLMDIVENTPRNIPFSLIHDSVAFRAGDVNHFYEQIRESFISVFEPDLLLNFKTQIETQHKGISLPDLPKQGKIDFSLIREASYAYH